MAYIHTGNRHPGIVELLEYKTSTGRALTELAHTLLLGDSALSSGERELIASYVSWLNDCPFCHLSHAAAANAHLGDNGHTIACIIRDPAAADISEKMKLLLGLAAKVRLGGKAVRQEDVDACRECGATDEEIHDTVLIAAAFCMFNRYVDGLGTAPAGPEEYEEMGKGMAVSYRMQE
ncbi:MAG: carboxymuconolactone decarboxylase family protein [Flavobacteriales bacterium]|jgi:uncharacterized peroxidase-related enzyme